MPCHSTEKLMQKVQRTRHTDTHNSEYQPLNLNLLLRNRRHKASILNPNLYRLLTRNQTLIVRSRSVRRLGSVDHVSMIFDRENLTFWTILIEYALSPHPSSIIARTEGPAFSFICAYKSQAMWSFGVTNMSGLNMVHIVKITSQTEDRSFMHIETLTETQTRFST